MHIDEIMTGAPRVIRERASIREAWDVLRALEVRHLPVVNVEGELIGIVSDRDFAVPPSPPLMDELIGSRRIELDAPVSTIMTGAPVSLEPDDNLAEAIDMMIENRVGALPVVGPEGEVIGIVSYLDILRNLREQAATAAS